MAVAVIVAVTVPVAVAVSLADRESLSTGDDSTAFLKRLIHHSV